MAIRDIKELHPVMQRAATEWLRRCGEAGLSVLITETYRSIERQNELYEQGRSKPGSIVTGVRGGWSIHNYRLAFDFCRNIRGREWDYKMDDLFPIAGKIWIDMGGEWGGTWTTLVDSPHCEWTAGLTTKDLRNGAIIPPDALMPWEKT